MVKLNEGTNTLRAVGWKDGVEVSDEIHAGYQTTPWTKPAIITFHQIAQSNGIVTIETRVFDANHVPCLDAANTVRFGLTGDGQLLDDLGTDTGSRVVQLYNGRAQINLRLDGERAVASVQSEGLPIQFLEVTNDPPSATDSNPALTIDVAAIDHEPNPQGGGRGAQIGADYNHEMALQTE